MRRTREERDEDRQQRMPDACARHGRAAGTRPRDPGVTQEQEFVTFHPAELITPFVVQMSGTAQCEPGDFVFVFVDIRQRPGGSGSGLTSFQCTQTNQMFGVDVIAGPFHPGPATRIGSAFRLGPSGFAFGRDAQTIRL